MIWPQPDIRVPSTIKSIYFRSLSCFRGWFSHNVMMSPTCEVHVMVGPTCPVASFVLSPRALPHEPLYHTSPSCRIALHAPSQEPTAVSLVFHHRTSSSSTTLESSVGLDRDEEIERKKC
jgi:hypothetical protein